MNKFSIIIPVFNHPNYTKICLDSVFKNIDKNEVEVIVVDNGSIAPTRKLLSQYQIKLIRNEINQGTAFALNQGINAANGENVVLLHNDCILNSSFMDGVNRVIPLLGKEIVIASPFSNYADAATFICDEKLMKRFVSYKYDNKSRPSEKEIFAIISELYAPFGGMDAYAKRFANNAPLTRVNEIGSFCMVSSKKTLMDIGLFDERFKLRGYEEKELLLRFHLNGDNAGLANFFVHHFGNITSDGPGFNVHDILDQNKEKLSEIRHFLINERKIVPPWTAVIFPDVDKSLAERAKENLKTLNYPPTQIVEIPHPGIFPMSAAWTWALPQVYCKYLALIDADMLLKKNAPERLLAELQKPDIGLSAAKLEDPCFGPLGHLVFWRTELLKKINLSPSIPVINAEMFYLNQVPNFGYYPGWINEVLGDHAIPLDPWRIFRAYFRRGLKQRLRGLGTAIAVAEISPSMKKGPWGHVAMLGFHIGISLDYAGDVHDPTFDAFADSHYQKVKSFCEAIVSEELTAVKSVETNDNRIRVAIICETLHIGGMEIIVSLTDKLIDKSKFKLFIYSVSGGPLESTLESELRISNQIRDIAINEMASWLQYDKIDVAMLMSLPCADQIFEYAKPCRVIERMDGISFPYSRAEGVVDVAIYESEDIKKSLPEYPCENYKIIPNGREPFQKDKNLGAQFREKIDAKDKIIIANVARIAKIKNQKLLIDAVELLVKDDCKQFKLVIMGPDREGLKKDFESDIKKRNLQDYIIFMNGDLETPKELWNAADICVNSSFTEGVAGSLIEACTVGLPIVATDVGATHDVVVDGNGKLVPSEDAVSFADALKFYITHPEERLKAGLRSLEISKKYSAKSMVKEFESLIETQALEHRKEIAKQPFITVLMPLWNRPEYLDEAIKSVLNQIDDRWRLLISIDDLNPKPEIIDIINRNQDPRISYVKWPHKNHCSAMNKALKVVKTPFILRLDSDDLLTPDAILVLNKMILGFPDIGWFYSSRTLINDKRESVLYQEAEEFSAKRLEERYITRLLCMRVSEILRAGGFAEDMYYGEDYLMALTMMLHGTKFKSTKDNLYLYRMHSASGISNSISAKDHIAYIDLLRQRYQKMKSSKGISWYGEDPSTMQPRDLS